MPAPYTIATALASSARARWQSKTAHRVCRSVVLPVADLLTEQFIIDSLLGTEFHRTASTVVGFRPFLNSDGVFGADVEIVFTDESRLPAQLRVQPDGIHLYFRNPDEVKGRSGA